MQLVIGKWHIQISRMNVPTRDRVFKVWSRRRKSGNCVQCGEKVTDISKYTNLLYQKCPRCRKRDNANAKLRRIKKYGKHPS